MKKNTQAAFDEWASVIESEKRVDDPLAITLREYATRAGISLATADRNMADRVSAGTARATTRKIGCRYVKAFRLVK